MSIPKEPRQMMINMMYLVLTALLALNVSAEILNAFHVVNEGIANSNVATDNKNAIMMAAFDEQMKKDPDKTRERYEKAKTAQKLVEELNKQIQEYMDLIVVKSGGWKDKNQELKLTGGWKPELGELADDKNLDVSTFYMLEEGRAKKLKDKIEETRGKLLEIITDPKDKKIYEQQLPIRIDQPRKNNEGQLKTWEDANFHMVPTIACLTLLNKFQNDAKNSEAQIIDYLFGDIYKKVNKVDKMVAKVIAPSSYIMAGQDYKADIFVAAYNSTVQPTVYIGGLTSAATKDANGDYLPVKTNPVAGGGTKLDVSNGMGKFTERGSGQGEKKYSGAVMVPDPEGNPVYYPFDASYTSSQAAAVISSDNLNIIYAGIPNPFSVSVPGFSPDKVTATASGGSFTGGKGKYIATMPATMITQKVKITVTVDDQGNRKQIGAGQEFIVKRIPDPVAKVAGKVEGNIKTGELKVSPGPIATLQDFYFQGVTFQVTSYDFIYIGKRQDPFIKANSGMTWSPDAKAKIDQAKPGDQIIIRNIKAKGPDGSVRSLSPIALTIN